MVCLRCRDPNAAQISQLRQQLAVARSEIGSLKRKLASSQDGGRPEFDSSVAPRSSDAIMALALDEMQQQNSSLDVDNARLKVELVRSPAGLDAWHAQRSQRVMSLCCQAVLCLACRLQLSLLVHVCAWGTFRAPGTSCAAHVSLLLFVRCQGSMALSGKYLMSQMLPA